jgi:DNA-binding MarR family transcriptional regulator
MNSDGQAQELRPSTVPPSDGSEIRWRPIFTAETFSQIPHACILMVLEKRLLPSDLITYAYFLGRASAMEAHPTKPKEYTIVPVSQAAKDLRCCPRTVRYSLSRLVKEGLIERQETTRNARTRILTLVRGGVVIWRAAVFPPKDRPPPPDCEPLPADMDDWEDSNWRDELTAACGSDVPEDGCNQLQWQ